MEENLRVCVNVVGAAAAASGDSKWRLTMDNLTLFCSLIYAIVSPFFFFLLLLFISQQSETQ